MMTDPKRELVQRTVRRPPLSGPGSGRDAWVRFAFGIAETNRILWDTTETQSAVIRDLEAELLLLRRQIAARAIEQGLGIDVATRNAYPM